MCSVAIAITMAMIFLLRIWEEVSDVKSFRNYFFLLSSKGNRLSPTHLPPPWIMKKPSLNYKNSKLFNKVLTTKLTPSIRKKRNTAEWPWISLIIFLPRESNTVISKNHQKVNRKITSSHPPFKEIRINLKKHLPCPNHQALI